MAKRNYKVYADAGRTTNNLARVLSVLDTGAEPNFIREDELPPGGRYLVKDAKLPNIADANNKAIRTTGTIDLVVRLGPRLFKLEFIVCSRLAAPVILGCDFCDRSVEAIYSRCREWSWMKGRWSLLRGDR